MSGTLTITGATIISDGMASPGDVFVRDGVIVSVAQQGSSAADTTLDGRGCFVAPGFIDMQLNGGFGVDFTSEPERVDEVAVQLPATGVTSFLPTVITSPPAMTANAISTIAARQGSPAGAARTLGVHLEGPFLNPLRRGAHPERHLRPASAEEAREWTTLGRVAMVTLAPELEGALDVIAELRAHGVVVCAGHTAATGDDLKRAFEAGLTGATHLYNAMGTMSARSPGTIGPLLTNRSVVCGLIADGVHVDPTMVRLAFAALGPRRLALVTDAIAALGLPHGQYRIGDTQITVDQRGARTTGDVLAGSVLRMDTAVRNLIAFTGCSLADASLCASTAPATLLGRTDLGRIEEGCAADLVVLDGDVNVVATIIDGVVVHDPHKRFGG